MKISRRVLKPDGTPKKEDKLVNIAIKPGWKSGTRVTFQKEGDQTHGKIPADIVFVVRDKPHPLYKREGSDIRFTARLTLKQVIYGSHFFFILLFIEILYEDDGKKVFKLNYRNKWNLMVTRDGMGCQEFKVFSIQNDLYRNWFWCHHLYGWKRKKMKTRPRFNQI